MREYLVGFVGDCLLMFASSLNVFYIVNTITGATYFEYNMKELFVVNVLVSALFYNCPDLFYFSTFYNIEDNLWSNFDLYYLGSDGPIKITIENARNEEELAMACKRRPDLCPDLYAFYNGVAFVGVCVVGMVGLIYFCG